MSQKKKAKPKPIARLYSRHISLGILVPENYARDLVELIQIGIPFSFKGYRNPNEKGYVVLEFEIIGTAETRFNEALESFFKEKGVTFDKPSTLRPKDEIKQVLQRAEKAAETSKKEVDNAHALLRDEKAIIVKRMGIHHGVIHALSWVMNQKGIGEIAPV